MNKLFASVLWIFMLLTWPGKAVSSRVDMTVAPGVENPVTAFDVKVFPNPVVNKRFTVETNTWAIQEIRILNIAGVEVLVKKMDTPINRVQIFTGTIPRGIYLLKISAGNQATKTLKLLISEP